MELPSKDDVITAVDAFLKRHDMAPTRFGRDATGDQNLVADLRRGASPSLDRLHRMSAFMQAKDAELEGADHEPADTAPLAVPSSGKAGEVSAAAVSA